MIIQITRCILIHGYKRKTSKQFLDFIKIVDRKYDDNGVKQIFLVLAIRYLTSKCRHKT